MIERDGSAWYAFSSRGGRVHKRRGMSWQASRLNAERQQVLIAVVGKRQSWVAEVVPVFLDSLPVERPGDSDDIHAPILTKNTEWRVKGSLPMF